MRHGSNDRGATVVLVATVLMLLFGFAALAIDAGLGYNDRRGTTNAADNAALAAAFEDCNPSGVGPEAAAAATAAANGYDNAAADTEVTTQSLPDEGEWQVTISEVNDAVFGVATPYAGNSLTVVSEAVALCDPTSFLEGMAVFAGSDNCGPDVMNLTGSSITVNGGIHSNEDLKIHATPETEHLSGPITYRGSGTHGTQVSGPPMEYPLDVDISEYRPGGDRATGGGPYFFDTAPIDNAWLESKGHIDTSTGLLKDSGIYYTSYSSNGQPAIDLHGLSAESGVTATFVSEGFIQVSGATDNLQGHDPIVEDGSVGMLFFSDHPGPPPGACNNTAIKISAPTFTNGAGVIYAPNGVIEFANSDADLNGSIIGWRINAHGSDLNVTYEDDPNFVPKYQVELIR